MPAPVGGDQFLIAGAGGMMSSNNMVPVLTCSCNKGNGDYVYNTDSSVYVTM